MASQDNKAPAKKRGGCAGTTTSTGRVSKKQANPKKPTEAKKSAKEKKPAASAAEESPQKPNKALAEDVSIDTAQDIADSTPMRAAKTKKSATATDEAPKTPNVKNVTETKSKITKTKKTKKTKAQRQAENEAKIAFLRARIAELQAELVANGSREPTPEPRNIWPRSFSVPLDEDGVVFESDIFQKSRKNARDETPVSPGLDNMNPVMTLEIPDIEFPDPGPADNLLAAMTGKTKYGPGFLRRARSE